MQAIPNLRGSSRKRHFEVTLAIKFAREKLFHHHNILQSFDRQCNLDSREFAGLHCRFLLLRPVYVLHTLWMSCAHASVARTLFLEEAGDRAAKWTLRSVYQYLEPRSVSLEPANGPCGDSDYATSRKAALQAVASKFN